MLLSLSNKGRLAPSEQSANSYRAFSWTDGRAQHSCHDLFGRTPVIQSLSTAIRFAIALGFPGLHLRPGFSFKGPRFQSTFYTGSCRRSRRISMRHSLLSPTPSSGSSRWRIIIPFTQDQDSSPSIQQQTIQPSRTRRRQLLICSFSRFNFLNSLSVIHFFLPTFHPRPVREKYIENSLLLSIWMKWDRCKSSIALDHTLFEFQRYTLSRQRGRNANTKTRKRRGTKNKEGKKESIYEITPGKGNLIVLF